MVCPHRWGQFADAGYLERPHSQLGLPDSLAVQQRVGFRRAEQPDRGFLRYLAGCIQSQPAAFSDV